MTTTDYRTKAEKDAAERFPRDTANHVMTVLHDDGLYRHLRFAAPGYGAYWFDLITLPNSLVFRGDGESFVFTILGTDDLFTLFRRTAHKGSINPGYWSEKLSSERDAATDYSKDLFDEQVATDLVEAEKTWPGVTEAWTEHVGEWSDYNTEYESEARRALDDFEFDKSFSATCSCGKKDGPTDSYSAAMDWEKRHAPTPSKTHKTSIRQESFYFSDTGEWDLRDYAWWFLWACHGIVSGIAQYDAAKAPAAEAVAS
jgi:hypothetical protein